MSSSTQNTGGNELVDRIRREFLARYAEDQVVALAKQYPEDKTSVELSWRDIFQWDVDVAQDYIDNPGAMSSYFEDAVTSYDLPVVVEFGDDVTVRVTDLGDEYVTNVSALRAHDTHCYRGVRGRIEQVTDARTYYETAVFECQQCGNRTPVPQSGDSLQEPHQCKSCERKGPFEIDRERSETTDMCRVKLNDPPGESAGSSTNYISVEVKGDLINTGGPGGLLARSGEKATFYGIVREQQLGSTQQQRPEARQYLDARAVEFERDSDEIEITPEVKDEIEKHAAADDAVQRFADSIAPQLTTGGDSTWNAIFKIGAAYLFAAPRIETDAATYRGDIHVGLIGDPGVGKSRFLQSIAEISPGCEHRSATGLASDVGLTAAAVKDDFDGNGWSLKAGILPRPEYHAIIDEIDKGPEELTAINDGMEGEQQVTVDKANIQATLDTRVGVMVSGNPDDGRFDPYESIPDQIGVDPSLMDRLDAIITIQDEADAERDRNVAEHMLAAYREASELYQADDEEVELDVLERRVDQDVLRAWVKYARDKIDPPQLTEPVLERLEEFYVESRALNGEDSETVATTPRKLEDGIRMSVAFARLRLHEEVRVEDAELAIKLTKQLIGQNYDPETGEFDADRVETSATSKAQRDRMNRVKSTVRELVDGREGAAVEDVVSAMVGEGFGEDRVRHAIERLETKGELYRPGEGVLRTSD